jgi:ribosomal protein S18 acetylase RimI-like enzyme
MRTLAARDWRRSDLRHMQAVVSAGWAARGALAPLHIGDLAWWVAQWEWPTADGPSGRRRLWFDGSTGQPVGWGWATSPSEFDFAVHPDRPDGAVHDEILAWARQCLDPVETSALDRDEASEERLSAAGMYRGDRYFIHLAVPLASLPPVPPRAAPGYTVRAVRGPADLAHRVDVHRTVWHPSRVTAASYRNVMMTWPYRAELDWVAVAPDGSFASSALAWLDTGTGSVEFEPVGTHPDHRRRGLARAVCTAALLSARRLGARVGVVYCEPDSPAQALYESVGFRAVATRYRWS